MMKTLFLTMGLFTTLLCLAQSPRMNAPIVSPEVHPDHSVTYRFNAPEATSVLLDALYLKAPVAMTKGENGIWTVTTDPASPDIYSYSFKIDGVTVMDPGNMEFCPNENFKSSLVDITDMDPLIHSVQNVPHGSVSYDLYPANAVGQGITGRMVVYTPPGYDKDSSVKFPVFYCISGTTDTEEVYFKVGRLNFIMDNLIAQGRALPCIVVMPYGNPMAYLPPKAYDADFTGSLFANELLNDIMPYVEKNYRTINDREFRAIGGFSRGGGQALSGGLSNLDKFATIISYSSFIGTDQLETTFKHLIDNPDKTNEQIKMFWLGVGNSDFLYPSAYDFMNVLSKYRINHIGFITNGGHTWMNARLFLHETFVRMWKEFK